MSRRTRCEPSVPSRVALLLVGASLLAACDDAASGVGWMFKCPGVPVPSVRAALMADPDWSFDTVRQSDSGFWASGTRDGLRAVVALRVEPRTLTLFIHFSKDTSDPDEEDRRIPEVLRDAYTVLQQSCPDLPPVLTASDRAQPPAWPMDGMSTGGLVGIVLLVVVSLSLLIAALAHNATRRRRS